MPVVSTAKMTARQFVMLGEDPPGVRLELVDGEVAVSPSPIPEHSRAAVRLSRILLNHVIENDLGDVLSDVDTTINKFNVRRPDLLYFTKARQHLIYGAKSVNASPDLCVEVLSPSSVKVDRQDKFKQYAKAKVKHYWILDPKNRTIEAYSLVAGKYREVARGRGRDVVILPPFPKLEIPLAGLWVPRRRS